VSVISQHLSYDVLLKKIKTIFNYFLLKKGLSTKFTYVNFVYFLVNYVFGQKMVRRDGW